MKEFTKNDLKSGQVVVVRNGNKYIVVGDLLIRDKGFSRISGDYKEDLTVTIYPDCDIMEVYEKAWGRGLESIDDLRTATLVWKREEKKTVTLEVTDEQLKKINAILNGMTKKQFFKKYVQPNTVVRCATEELANELLAKAHEYGLAWLSGKSYLEDNKWDNYKEETCYCLFDRRFCDIEWYQDHNFTIIEFNGFGGETNE